MGAPLLPTSHSVFVVRNPIRGNKEAVLHFETRAKETGDAVETLDLEKKSD